MEARLPSGRADDMRARTASERRGALLSGLLRIVRGAARLPGARFLTSVDPLLRVSFALRGSLVRESARFALNELRGRSAVSTYRLRSSGIAVTVRHGTADVLVLDSVFSQGEYELAPPVEATLAVRRMPLRVVDLGANIGLFAAYILGRFPTANVVAFEPDPGNAAIHARTIAENGLEARWHLIQAFAATNQDMVRFTARGFSTARAALNDEQAVEVPGVDVFPYLDEADLVKVDIEGAEWAILTDPRFATLRPGVVAVEYHPVLSPEPDPRIAAESALRRAGYAVVQTRGTPTSRVGLLWGWRRDAE